MKTNCCSSLHTCVRNNNTANCILSISVIMYCHTNFLCSLHWEKPRNIRVVGSKEQLRSLGANPVCLTVQPTTPSSRSKLCVNKRDQDSTEKANTHFFNPSLDSQCNQTSVFCVLHMTKLSFVEAAVHETVTSMQFLVTVAQLI